MTNEERNKAMEDGKCIIRAILTRWGWKVMKMTDRGGWTPFMCREFDTKEETFHICQKLAAEYPDIYLNDNN